MKYFTVIAVLIGFPLEGCAFDIAHVKYHPIELTAQASSQYMFTINEEVQITQTPCGYSRILQRSSTWVLIGTISQGDVYKPKNQTLTVECSNVHEAYLVMQDNSLIGFYLPVEKGFVSLPKAINVPKE